MTEQPYLSPYDAGQEAPQASLYGRASGPRSSFWRRLVASLVDGLIVGIPTWIVVVLVSGVHLTTHRSGGSTRVSFDGPLFLAGLVVGLVILVYGAILDGGPRGQTLGKRALGIRVVDTTTGASIGYVRGFGRATGKFGANLLINACFIGVIDYLWVFWDRENQALHDKMVSSYVVPEAAYPLR